MGYRYIIRYIARYITVMGFALCGLCSLLVAPIFAMETSELTQARVEVPDRSLIARQHGIERAYEKVLIKQSGNPHVMTLPVIQNNIGSLKNLENTVQSYRYDEDTLDPNRSPRLWLQVTFDPNSIQQTLRDAGQPIWGDDRLPTLIIPPASSTWEYRVSLQNAAKSRGLGVLMLIGYVDTAVDFKKLAESYDVTSILAACTDPHDPSAIVWQYWEPTQKQEWTAANTSGDAIESIMDKLMETLANRHATFSSAMLQNSVFVQVSHIIDFNDYKEVSRFLNDAPGVTDVMTRRVQPDQVLFEIRLGGELETLAEALGHDPRIAPDPIRRSMSTEKTIYYCWRPEE